MGLVFGLVLWALPSADAAVSFGHVVQIEQLSFHPDTVNLPGDNFAVLVVILAKFLVKPIKNTLDARRQAIADQFQRPCTSRSPFR